MANKKSSIKRIRQNLKRKMQNKHKNKIVKTMIKKIISTKINNSSIVNNTISKIDKLVKDNIIHKNKASRLKSKIINKI